MLLPHSLRALLLLMLLLLGARCECPPGCVCMWKSGKETTECINQDKKEIPPGIEPSTQVLNIRGNTLKLLEDNIFLQLGITNLQRLYCSYCSISEVQPRAFRRLTNLIELDLSENALKEIPTQSWKYTKALMKLSLSGNPIKLIRAGAFKRLSFVTNLHLAHCEIETIEAEAFLSLESLLELKLDNNRLTYILGTGLFPRSLHQIEIHGNPFTCDCRLLDFVDWIQGSGVPRSLEPLCYRPLRLENASISAIDLSELACLPQVEPPVSKSVLVQGSANVSLRCSVYGIPKARVSWWHSNRLVANGTTLDHPWEAQYYRIKEVNVNPHKLISEIVIFEIRQEDNGFFYCSASNPAGVVRANFTLQVIPKTESDPLVKTTKEDVSDVESLNNPLEEENSNVKIIDDMLKVEYILGFGAAAVVILTILIIMILYLVLQCRSRRYKSRLSRALHCDSNSSSYIERSTVDFIVPGEMELTSAVRSVSCSSVISKCNGASKERSSNSTDDEADKDEDEYGGRKRRTPRALRKTEGLRPPLYGPPSYKHPPPPCVPEPLCRCCGEPQWRHPSLPLSLNSSGGGGGGYLPPRFVTPYQEAQHIRDCPRNSTIPQRDCGNYSMHIENNSSSFRNGDLPSNRFRSNSLRYPKKINRPPQFPGERNFNNYSNTGNNLHYVTMSRGLPGYPRADLLRYAASQPHLNFPRSMNSMHPNHQNILTPMSLETSITLPPRPGSIPTPRYPYLPRQLPSRYTMSSNNSYIQGGTNEVKPVSHTGENESTSSAILYANRGDSSKKDEDYLFPDLPPPPGAILPILKNSSRSSSLDDLSSDSRGYDNSLRTFYTLPNHHPPGQVFNHNHGGRRRSSYRSRKNSNNSNNTSNNLSESAVRIDLSDADKSIRRPGSAPDLAQSNLGSPVRSVLRCSRQLEHSIDQRRRSIIINPASKGTSKKVMFTGVSDEGEEEEEENSSSVQEVMPIREEEREGGEMEEDPVWVLRSDKTDAHPKNHRGDVPLSGIVVANKYGPLIPSGYPGGLPPKIIQNPLSGISLQQQILTTHASSSESSSGTVSNAHNRGAAMGRGSSAGSTSSVTSTPPNPQVQQQQQPSSLRPGNPALQRPVQPHFHESPDEGYHEEDAGSETL